MPNCDRSNPGPCVYMHKIAVGPEAAGSIDITATPTQNLRWIAKAKGEAVRDLTVVILDRPRHDDLIAEVLRYIECSSVGRVALTQTGSCGSNRSL